MAKGLRIALFPLVLLAALMRPAVCRAQDCGTWRYRTLVPHGIAAAMGGGITVIISGVDAFSSRDGANWQWARVSGGHMLSNIVWGAGRFVVATDAGITASEDGVTWSDVATVTGGTVLDVGWDGSSFLALGIVYGGNAFVMKSSDGLRWTTEPLTGDEGTFWRIKWAGSRWFGLVGSGASGSGYAFSTSDDGVTWTTVLADVSMWGVAWNGSMYLAFGVSLHGSEVQILATSTDGLQWTVQPVPSGLKFLNLASDGHQFVGIVSHQTSPISSYEAVVTSQDGVNWHETTQFSADVASALSWNDPGFIAVGGMGYATSSDAVTWQVHTVSSLATIISAGSRFVVFASWNSGAHVTLALTSADGASWVAATDPPDGPVTAAVWTGSQLVAVGPGGGVFISADGDTWARQATSGLGFTDLAAVAWNGTTLVAMGGGRIFTSTDTVNWSPTATLDGAPRAIAWGGGRFVVVGSVPYYGSGSSCPAIWTSSNGREWAFQGPPLTCPGTGNASLNGVAWNGARFVAAGSATAPAPAWSTPVVLTSTDATSWSASDLSQLGAAGFSTVTWIGMGFAAVTSAGALLTSYDGVVWTLDSQLAGYASAVAGDGRRMIALGASWDWDIATMDCTAPPPIGQPGVTNAVLVTAARTPGLAGTQWITDVELFNAWAEEVTALLYYLPRDTDNTVATRRAVAVPSGQAVRLGDVVGQLFGLSKSAGALIVSSKQPLLVTSRTSTGSSAGTLGQFVPGLAESAALAARQEGRLIQLSENAGYRANVGFASVSAAPISVTVKLYRASGELLGTMPVTLAPFGSAQVTEILPKIGVASVDDAFAVVRSDTPGAQYYAYASVVDNVSGDPLTVLPVPASAAEPLYLPAVAHNPGLNGTMWRTDLEVANPGAVQAVYRMELLKSAQDNTTASAATFMLDPGTSRRYLDVVKEVFGFAGSGAIRVTPTAGAVMATARSYTDSGSGSRGQFIPAAPLSHAIAAGPGARLIQLTHSADGTAGFRTNIGFVNATAAQLNVQANLYSAGGNWLGTRVDKLAPYEFIQDTGIFGTVTTSDVADGFAVVNCSTTGAQFFAYASVIDNQSGAPVYVPAQ